MLRHCGHMADPHIVLFDIESLPNLPAALEHWPSLSDFPGNTLRANINSIACVGWKVLGASETNCIHAWDFKGWFTDVNDDRELCEALYLALSPADCVITHNGKRFDWKFIQTRFRKHGMQPLPDIKHVDTCEVAKRNLFLLNNRLNTVARFLTEQEKMKHDGWDLWVAVHNREPEAMRTMSEYCKKDVEVLEEVFRSLRPFAKQLPNANLFSPLKEKACPSCGSSRIQSEGLRHTRTRSYRRYICRDCKTWSHTDVKDEVPR